MIAGIAVSLSMTASEYLSTKSEGGGQYPIKASAYTGSAYVLTVILLILPYFLFHSYLASLGLTLLNAAVVTLVFTFSVSVARDISFWRRFLEMALISFGAAGVSFAIGFLVRGSVNIDV